MDDLIKRKCRDLAVRIGLNGGRSLLGSGVIMVPGHKEYALVITAAHIFNDLNPGEDLLHLYFVGCMEDPQNTELAFVPYEDFNDLPDERTAHLYRHSEYKWKQGQYPENDAAILQIPYTSWMDSLPVFQLNKQEIKSPMLMGFPSMDNFSQNDRSIEMNSEYVTFRGDIYCEDVQLTDQNARNLVVKKVFKDIIPFNTGNSRLDGLSGGGIFSYVSQGIIYNGAFVSDRLEDDGSFFATDVSVFKEMIQAIGIRIGIPEDIASIQKNSLEHFISIGDDIPHMWLKKKSDVYLKSLDQSRFFKDSFVGSNVLSCTEYRPSCRIYYVGKLIGSVLFSSVYGISPIDVNNQYIQIGSERVQLFHICSENSIELVVQEALTGSAFSVHGPFRNKSIFIVNSKNPMAFKLVGMGKCRRIITSVLGRMDEEFRFREDFSDLYELLSENNRKNEYAGFSIIQGDLAKAQIAFLPLKDLEAIMENSVPNEEYLKNDIDNLIKQVWRE